MRRRDASRHVEAMVAPVQEQVGGGQNGDGDARIGKAPRRCLEGGGRRREGE